MPSLDMLSELIPAFVTLFVIIDPIGLVPVFIVLTQGTDTRHRRRMAIRACIASFLILAAFAVVGESVLGIFGIHMPAFRIAGGTVVFLIALEMLFERRSQKRNQRAEQVHQELEDEHELDQQITDAKPAQAEDEPDDISIFPMSIPFLAGPGSIATVMLLMGKYENSVVMQVSVVAVVGLVMLCALTMFLLANLVAKRLSPTVATVISRLLGMILAALAVQFIIDGIKQAFF